MDKIKILVACHKPARVYRDAVYMPVHVGKALHPQLDMAMPGDDSGDNISLKNASYCELTAQYWGWKNLHTEYIGLCHYRRYFEPLFTAENVESLLGECDIVLSAPLHMPCSVDHFWMQKLIPEDVTILYLVLQKHFPTEYPYAERYLLGNRFYPGNMFVCRKELFDSFAAWQFRVLGMVEEVLPLSAHSRERRIFGYMGEALLSIWCMAQGLRIRPLPVVDYPGKKAIPLPKTRLKRHILNAKTDLHFALHRPHTLTWGHDYLQSLQQDGILQKIDHLC